MNIQKAREERRNFYVGGSQEHGTFSSASAEASTLHGEFYLIRRNADEVSWKHLSVKEQIQFSKAIETEWQGVLDFKVVTVVKADSHLQIDPSTVCVIDAKSTFGHLVRESTGGHCRRTAQELCVIRRSMETL